MYWMVSVWFGCLCFVPSVPGDGDHFRGRVELHGARAKWDHAVVEGDVLTLAYVPHARIFGNQKVSVHGSALEHVCFPMRT